MSDTRIAIEQRGDEFIVWKVQGLAKYEVRRLSAADIYNITRCTQCEREWTPDSLPPAVCERNHQGRQELLTLIPVETLTP